MYSKFIGSVNRIKKVVVDKEVTYPLYREHKLFINYSQNISYIAYGPSVIIRSNCHIIKPEVIKSNSWYDQHEVNGLTESDLILNKNIVEVKYE